MATVQGQDRLASLAPYGIKINCLNMGGSVLGGQYFAQSLVGSPQTCGWPRVSIIVPCYNYGKWLRQCIESVFAQEIADVEIIIVNDASTDNSLEVAKSIESKSPQVRVINNLRNKGHIPSVNSALEAATGKYLVKLDADDLLPAGSLGRSLAVLEENPNVGFVYGRCLSFGAQLKGITPTLIRFSRHRGLLLSERTGGVNYAGTSFPYRVWAGKEWLKLRCQRGVNCISQPEVLIRRSVMQDVGFYDESLPHTSDLAMWLELSARSDVAYINGPIQGLYRVHSGSMQRTVNAGNLRDLSGRLAAFESVLSRVSHLVPVADDLLQISRKAIASQALDAACCAIERGRAGEEPIDQYEMLAFQTYPASRTLREWQVLQTRRASSAGNARWNPAYVAATLKRRFLEERKWRHWWNSGV